MRPDPLAGRVGRRGAGVPGGRRVERPAALLLRDPLLPPAQAQQHHHQRLKVSEVLAGPMALSIYHPQSTYVCILFVKKLSDMTLCRQQVSYSPGGPAQDYDLLIGGLLHPTDTQQAGNVGGVWARRFRILPIEPSFAAR